MKVLYLSNKEVPYRVAFFNLLAQHVDLTVVYDTRNPGNRDKEWAKSVKATEDIHISYLPANPCQQLSELLRILKTFTDGFLIIGCVNTFTGLSAIAMCRMLRIHYLINLDGEIFYNVGIKAKIKKIVLSGASGYLTAGEAAAHSLRCIARFKRVFPYSFSSLSDADIAHNKRLREQAGLPDLKAPVLVVGQYANYKGLDLALAAARADRSIPFVFVGTGSRTEQFIADFGISPQRDSNITVIPFLHKSELTDMYLRCSILLLPSRYECWGLVVNEAASLGTPIVGSCGSGSAVEFLFADYPDYLAVPEHKDKLIDKIRMVRNLNPEKLRDYSHFLMRRASKFSIEKSVEDHLMAFHALNNQNK